jgi:hypothetical protein
MTSRTCLLLIPMILFAQEQAPPYVEQALRERVSGFYQNFMEGSFSPRKAEQFIAEDTKDYFYNAGKLKFIAYKIEKITYSDDFTKAEVVILGKGTRVIAGHAVVMEQPYPTKWKIEDGKWCWTYSPYDVAATPMGGRITPPDPAGPKLGDAPKDVSPEAIQRAGASIVRVPMGLDQSEVTINAAQAGSSQVIFTNGADGSVAIALNAPKVRGLTATLDKTAVPAHGTAVLTLHYDPTGTQPAKDLMEPQGRIPLRIFVSPFERVYAVNLVFTAAR